MLTEKQYKLLMFINKVLKETGCFVIWRASVHVQPAVRQGAFREAENVCIRKTEF